MKKFKVFWWIRGTGGKVRKQGHDIIEVSTDLFDITEVEDLIQEDLNACLCKLGGGSGASTHFNWYYDPEADDKDFKPKLPNFLKVHREIMKEVNSVSNWGVRKLKCLSQQEKN